MAKKQKEPSRKSNASKPGARKRVSKSSMKYVTDGERIEALRKILGHKQSKFAEVMRVSQSRISAWESGDERPSKEAFLRLGQVAKSEPDLRDWFWQQAGDLLDLATEVGEQVLRRRGQPSPAWRTVSLPCYRRTGRMNESVGSTWPVKADRVANLGSTYCLLIGQETQGCALRRGDAVVLDASSVYSPDLRPFLDQIVLVDIDANKPRHLDPDWQSIQRPDGLCIGRLRLKLHWQEFPVKVPIPGQRAFTKIETTTASGSPLWFATLAAPGDLEQEWNPSGDGIYLGAWLPHSAPGGVDMASWQSWMDQCSEEAAVAIRLEEGCSILGRVIDWSPGGARQEGQQRRKDRSKGDPHAQVR